MTRISSRWTWFNKRAFPILWSGMLTIIFVNVLLDRHAADKSNFIFIIPLVIALIGICIGIKFLSSLADEVWDDGKALIVQKSGQQLRIPLSDIVNLSYTPFGNSSRATLRLRNETRLGREISFLPQRDCAFSFFPRNRMIEELIDRIDAERRR